MRPIVRGDRPCDATNNPIIFTRYQEARGALIANLGAYCSYCEMKLDASLAVEHIQPKKPPGAHDVDQNRTLDWENLLLSCSCCNSSKFNKDVVLSDYFWPDRDNTFRALRYTNGGIVETATGLMGNDLIKALNTIKLTGLDKCPDDSDLEASDRRWLNRRDAYKKALRSKKRLEEKIAHNHDGSMDKWVNFFQDQIAETVTGYWSIWMTVFHDHPEMLQRFINMDSHPGTCKDCFDSEGKAVVRPVGA